MAEFTLRVPVCATCRRAPQTGQVKTQYGIDYGWHCTPCGEALAARLQTTERLTPVGIYLHETLTPEAQEEAR